MNALTITDSQKLSEIKVAFSSFFPHLKIEFFAEPHIIGEASTNRKKYDETLTIKDISNKHNSGTISVDGHQKTSTFESKFREQFGVTIQVLRKSGNVWLQTTATDDWSLAHQEAEGTEFDQ